MNMFQLWSISQGSCWGLTQDVKHLPHHDFKHLPFTDRQKQSSYNFIYFWTKNLFVLQDPSFYGLVDFCCLVPTADVRNSWMRRRAWGGGKKLRCNVAFSILPGSHRKREGGGEKAGGDSLLPPPTLLIPLLSPCPPLFFSLSTFLSLFFQFSHTLSLFFPQSPTLPLSRSPCKRGSCLSVSDLTCLTEVMKWGAAITVGVFKLLLNYPSARLNRLRSGKKRKLQHTYSIIKYSLPRHTLRKKRKKKGKCRCVIGNNDIFGLLSDIVAQMTLEITNSTYLSLHSPVNVYLDSHNSGDCEFWEHLSWFKTVKHSWWVRWSWFNTTVGGWW